MIKLTEEQMLILDSEPIKITGGSNDIRDIGLLESDLEALVQSYDGEEYLNLTEMLEAFYKRPIDEIYVENTQEVDVGDPKGNEIW